MNIQGIGQSYAYASLFSSLGTQSSQGSGFTPPAPPDAATLIENEDTNEYGVLSVEETRLTEEMFTDADTDSDGTLTLEELEEMLANGPPAGGGGMGGMGGMGGGGGMGSKPMSIESIFETEDTDGDGKISAEESVLSDEMFSEIDTDQDGLNDYEELNFYNTSAYLPDTDSDGLTDKEEVDKGSDPLCPKGEICAIAEAEPEVEESPEEIITLPAQEQLKSGGLMGASGLGDLTDLASVEELLKDPALIREALIASGEISQEELNQIDDETLVALIEQIIAEEESGNLNSQ